MFGLAPGAVSNQRVRLAAFFQPFGAAFKAPHSAAHVRHRQMHPGHLAALTGLQVVEDTGFKVFGFGFGGRHGQSFMIALAPLAGGH